MFCQCSCSIVEECLDAFYSAESYNVWVRQPTPQSIPKKHDRYTNPKHTALTSRCLGAIDGTHIPAHPPAHQAMAFRNRKGHLSFNVLAGVTLDEYFCYVYASWEGSAHDAQVYQSALVNGGFIIPEGYYYLADAGYSDLNRLLVPYRATRYHLKEWGAERFVLHIRRAISSNQELTAIHARPANKKELYNLRHSSTRNAIERAFGVVKRKYRVSDTWRKHGGE